MRPDGPYLKELARRGYLSQSCGRCGSTGPHNVGAGAGPHPFWVRCSACGAKVCFPPKPGNFDKRRHQGEYRQAWRDLLGGQLVCAFCGISEDHATAFHVDHMVDKAGAGELIDEFWNTLPLCNACHNIKTSLRAMTRRAARTGAVAIEDVA